MLKVVYSATGTKLQFRLMRRSALTFRSVIFAVTLGIHIMAAGALVGYLFWALFH